MRVKSSRVTSTDHPLQHLMQVVRQTASPDCLGLIPFHRLKQSLATYYNLTDSDVMTLCQSIIPLRQERQEDEMVSVASLGQLLLPVIELPPAEVGLGVSEP